jgi:hypothetical protein
MMSGRFVGPTPRHASVRGTTTAGSVESIPLVPDVSADVPVAKMVAKQQIQHLAARAWQEGLNSVEGGIFRRQVSGECLRDDVAQTHPLPPLSHRLVLPLSLLAQVFLLTLFLLLPLPPSTSPYLH